MKKHITRSLTEIATAVGVETQSGWDSIQLSGLADLPSATAAQLSYCRPNHRAQLAATAAGAVITTAELAPLAPCPALVVARPRLAWAHASQLFVAAREYSGIDPAAQVHPEAQLGKDVSIAAGTVIEAAVRIGDGAIVGANCWLGQGVAIGARTYLAAQVSCYSGVSIGADCELHVGVVVGADGFGFERDDKGVWHKIAQIGGVRIGDRVDIGANTTIDSGSLQPTIIADGVKIDNQVQIGHGCQIGENCLLCAGAMVGGSVEMGEGCVLAGNNAIKSGICLAPGTVVAGSTTLTSSTTEPGRYLALFPAKKHRDWLQFLKSLGRSESL